MKKTGALLLIIFCYITLTNAQVYVATEGNDETGTGGKTDPVLTLRKASDLAQAGDTIWVRGGVYQYGQNQSVSTFEGTETAWLTIKAYPGEAPILDGGKQENTDNESVFQFWNCKYCAIDGITVRNSSGRGITVSISHHMVVRNCIVHDIQTRGLGASGSDILIENNEVYNAVLENEGQTYQSGGWAAAISTYSNYETGEACRDISIRNNYIHNCWGEGIIPMRGHNIIVEGNRVANCFSVGIYPGNLANGIVRANHIWFDDTTYWRDGEKAMNGITWNIENWGYSIGEYGVDGLEISNNLIAGCRKGLSWYEEGSGDYNTYRNVKVYHNTVYAPTESAFFLYDVQEGAPGTHGNECYNNIFDGGVELAGSADAWTFSNNLWTGSIPGQGSHAQSLSGDAHFSGSDVSDPNAFLLQSGSPAIDKGMQLDSTKTDYWGSARDNSPDIGFHEYGTPSSNHMARQADACTLYMHAGQVVVETLPGYQKVYICDANGRLIVQRKTNPEGRLMIPLPNLAQGVYFCIVLMEGHTICTKKFMYIR